MNPRWPLLLLGCFWFSTVGLPAQAQTLPAIFPDEDPLTPADYRLVWPASPGQRYEVRQSTDLRTWTVVPGFPATADGPAQQLPFTVGSAPQFFQVVPIDEQPPALANQFPSAGGFAIRRSTSLTVALTDVTGVDPASLQLTVGALAPAVMGDPRLTFTNGVLTFTPAENTSLGIFGATVPATLLAADVLGNRGTNTWSFTLELEPQVVPNLFVFGSLPAQASGQRIGDIPTAVLAKRVGPVLQNADPPWTLESVQPDRLVLAYKQAAPAFAAGTYVCNLTPATTDEIFYRKITSVSDDAAGRLTLVTVDVPLEEMIEEGSVALSGDSVILETTATGLIARAFQVDGSVTFPRVGWSLDGTKFTLKASDTDFDLVRFTAEELHWWLTPRLQAGLEIKAWRLKRFEAIASGKINLASVAQVDFLLDGIAHERTLFDLPEAAEPKHHLLLGFIGIPPLAVPVYASLGFDVKLKARAEAKANLNFRWGMRQEVDSAFGVAYTAPDVRWVREFRFAGPEVVPFVAGINVEGSFKLSLEPTLEFLVYGLAGVSVGISPSAGVVFEGGTTAPLSGRLKADVDLELGLAGPALAWIKPRPELSLNLWNDQWHLFPKPAVIAFTAHPASQTVNAGASAQFTCSVATTETPAYQWFYQGVPLPGERGRTLFLPRVRPGHAGQYHVRATAGGASAESERATLTVRAAAPPPAGIPAGMAYIPAGRFEMGDTFNEGPLYERPVHTVQVSAFYMDKYEVTKGLWDEVYSWALTHGYRFDNAGSGKAANHPVHSIDWYDMVKWCNARSEKAGLTPSYYTDAGQTTVYRTGQVNVQNGGVKWNAGYRLPTEAEWEKAARGGLDGRRFPWGDTISHVQANYYGLPASSGGFPFGYHPTYATGGFPYTSPVGSFAANGYGLYDMTGNVFEWCWDWYGAYGSASQTDPRGPATGSYRVIRGGGWGDYAIDCRSAFRGGYIPDYRFGIIGFRVVLAPSQ